MTAIVSLLLLLWSLLIVKLQIFPYTYRKSGKFWWSKFSMLKFLTHLIFIAFIIIERAKLGKKICGTPEKLSHILKIQIGRIEPLTMPVLPHNLNSCFFWVAVTVDGYSWFHFNIVLALIYWSNKLEPFRINLNQTWYYMWPAERKPAIFTKFWFAIKLY